MNDTRMLASRIPGWGADLKPEHRAGVPKEKSPPNGTGAHWSEPEKQKPPGFKIYKTLGREELTPVFGATCPPKGLSGKMRDLAYGISEGQMSRWVIMLMADRVDMVESILSDVVHGRAGNPFSQMGLGIEFKERGPLQRFPRNGVAVALGLGVAGLLAARWARPSKAA